MKLTNVTKANRGGFTLIEITLVISLILGLITVLVVGAQAFREGSDRARCIMNIGNVQKAVRSWSNLNEINPSTTAAAADSAYLTTFAGDIVGPGKFLETTPICPGSGTYTFTTHVPAVGEVASTCSLGPAAQKNHAPKGSTDDGATMAGW